MNRLTRRYNATTNWRQVGKDQLPSPASAKSERQYASTPTKFISKLSYLFASSNFSLALAITIVIILVQLFVVHHYLGSHKSRQALISRRHSSQESFILRSPTWLCYSYSHLNKLADLAAKHHIELVIVDQDLLKSISGGDSREIDDEISHLRGLTKQEGSHKTIIHLAVINETSGGQPNLLSFHDDLKNYYQLLKYDDTSETMAPEVYNHKSDQLDDMHSDALRQSLHQSELMRQQQQPDTYEISKIYTEFIAHLFLVNKTSLMTSLDGDKTSKLCARSVAETRGAPLPFIVIHLFVLYNYEYRPQEEWIQSSLVFDEIERHKLLAFGVHSIDFKVPIRHYYTHSKRDTLSLSQDKGQLGYTLEAESPIGQLRVFKPKRLLVYANNTYLHCKPSRFSISGLSEGNRKLNDYLRSLDASKPPRTDRQHSLLLGQISIALQFMDVFSKTYGQFRYWLTGSSLLSYYKFCQLTAGANDPQGDIDGDQLMMYNNYEYTDQSEKATKMDKSIMLDLEIGLLASDVNPKMLSDLSDAKMIGVTMISNWRKTNNRLAFHVTDCPNILFNLHFYELKRDFYQHFYVTNDNMIHKHKFKRKRLVSNMSDKISVSPDQSYVGHHVFTTSNLDLCWTRLDNVHPFRVPCDVHDHLRRIYII